MEENIAPQLSYTTSHLARPRWNVLDILEHISRYSESVHLFCDIDVEAAEKLAERLSAKGDKITVTTILLKAISVAQLSHTDSATIRLPFGALYKRKKPIAGFTVEREVNGHQAVFFGNIRDAQTKPLAQIARELAAYGRNDVESVTQLSKETVLSRIPYFLRQVLVPLGCYMPAIREFINPATFGLTSLGKFGLGNVVAPNVTTSIFGIGSMDPKPVVVGDKIEIRKIMAISYSLDSKIYDMYRGARFLSDVKALMESGLAGHLHESEEAQVEEEKEHKSSSKSEGDAEPAPPEKSDKVTGIGFFKKPSEAEDSKRTA